MAVTNFRWMEVYPEKWTVHVHVKVAHDAVYCPFFSGVYLYPQKIYNSHSLNIPIIRSGA